MKRRVRRNELVDGVCIVCGEFCISNTAHAANVKEDNGI